MLNYGRRSLAIECQSPSKRRKNGKTDGQRDTHVHQQRPPQSPPSRRVDVAATRRPAAKDTSLCPFVRLLDGVCTQTGRDSASEWRDGETRRRRRSLVPRRWRTARPNTSPARRPLARLALPPQRQRICVADESSSIVFRAPTTPVCRKSVATLPCCRFHGRVTSAEITHAQRYGCFLGGGNINSPPQKKEH